MISIDLILSILVYGVALSGILPLTPYLERLPLLLLSAAFIAGIALDRRASWLGSRWATILSIACSAWYLLQVNRHNLAAPMVSLAAALLAIRFVTEKSHRNYLQIIALSLFCLAASSLYGLSPYFLLFLLLQLFLVTLSLVFLTFYQQDPKFFIPRKALAPLLKTAISIPLVTIPLIFFFFLILPRTQLPLWNIMARSGSERAGVSENLQPGDKAAISLGNGSVFRAAMEKVPQERLYWRCMILNSFNGKSWQRVAPPAETLPSPVSEVVEQIIFLEPGRTPSYPGLDIPLQVTGIRSGRTPDNLFQPYQRGGVRLKYRVHSTLKQNVKLPEKMKVDRKFYTALPQGIPAGLLKTGKDLAQGGGNDSTKIERLEKLFLDSHLNYGTTGLPTGSGAMEDFLFRSRKGHCELFASTFALLLRIAGVPSRLVGGYLGGEYSDIGGYYLVTEERAHVWVEAWVEGSGWISIDPSRLTENFGEIAGKSGKSFKNRIAVYLDAMSYYWNSIVINYDLESQVSLAMAAGAGIKQFQVPRPSLSSILAWAATALLIAVALLLARKKRVSNEERILKRLEKLLRKRYGVGLSPAAGLLSTIAPLHEPELNRFVEIYSAAVYHDCPLSNEELVELRKILAGLEKRKG